MDATHADPTAALLAALDDPAASPGDVTLALLALADALEEAGDPRAAGLRPIALGTWWDRPSPPLVRWDDHPTRSRAFLALAEALAADKGD